MAVDAMTTVLSIPLFFFRIQVQLCSLNVYIKKSLVIIDLKPSEVTFLRLKICGKMSYKGLKALAMDETKARHYETRIIVNDRVSNVRFSFPSASFSD